MTTPAAEPATPRTGKAIQMSAARQRLVGLVVLVVVAVAALVTAQLHPPVTGDASRAPIPGPPAVGDCLLDPAVITAQSLIVAGSKPSWLRTGPCQGQRFGEVTAVLSDKDLPPSPASSSSTNGNNSNGVTVPDPYRDLCRIAVTAWIGLPTPDTPIVDRWLPDPAVGVVLSGPNPIQRAAGQDWTACIIAVNKWQTSIPDAAVNGTSGRATAGYDSTTRTMFNPGPPLPAFAYCVPNLDNPEPVPCTTAHTVELIGTETTDHPTTEADRRGCHTLTQQLTAMPDPTAAGKLTLTTIDDPAPTASQHFLTCLISTTGQHQLTGPLLGLKNKPIPIT